jgi:hypothetical protein
VNRNDELWTEKLHDIAQQVEPAEGFRLSLERELRTQHEQLHGARKPKMTLYLRRLTTIAAALGLLVAMILLVPPFRSLAQDLIDSLFIRAESNEKTQTYPTISDPKILKAEDYYATLLTIDEAEEAAHFDVKFPDNVPTAYVFRGVSYSSDYHTTMLVYSLAGRGLEISQQPLEYVDQRQSDWPVGADAEIVKVEIGGLTGEYVEGTWIVKGSDLDVDKSTGMTTEKATWLADAPFRRLRWTDDSFLYEIRAMGGSEGHGELGQQDLIDMALNMQTNTQSGLLTIETAEALADFDLKVPDKIPFAYPSSTYMFRGVAYIPEDHIAKLIYSLAGRGLEISQQPLAYVDLQKGDWPVGVDAEIVEVQIGSLNGEYVEGGWVVNAYSADSDTMTITAKATWSADTSERRLRWVVRMASYTRLRRQAAQKVIATSASRT